MEFIHRDFVGAIEVLIYYAGCFPNSVLNPIYKLVNRGMLRGKETIWQKLV